MQRLDSDTDSGLVAGPWPHVPLAVGSADMYVADTGTAKGRGVFAARDFTAGEVVELAPVVLFDSSFGNLPSQIRELLFNWAYLAESSTAHGLALGYGSLYNHANPANLRYEADPVNRVLRFIAARHVAAGEELTINYNATGGGNQSEQGTWFACHGVDEVEAKDA